MEGHWEVLDDPARANARAVADDLERRGIGLLTRDDPRFPDRLRELDRSPAHLYYWGNLGLLAEPGVGMCGSRNVSPQGIDAARACGEEVARSGWHIISGYAKGVDTETHLAALRAGAGTVVVLAEGILNFRRKRVFQQVPFDAERVLVLSQFGPRTRWNVGAAMTRNAIIAALGEALVVIEAGETGGTLDAGKKALEAGKNVYALEFSGRTPPGNLALLRLGARPLTSRRAWAAEMSRLEPDDHSPPQARLPGA